MSRRLLQPADLHMLAHHAPELAQIFVSLASDIALVLDEEGRVLDVAQDPDTPMTAAADAWLGKPWIDSATAETRPKIQRMLGDVLQTGMGRRREVNHACGLAGDIPVAYTALRLGLTGPVLVVGRDLRTVSAIQQRFVLTQQETEQAYWRARQAETRHRLLLQVATDAVMTVDAEHLQLIEGNPAASVLLQGDVWPLAGRVAEHQFDAQSRAAVHALLTQARSTTRPAEIQARLAGSHLAVKLLALPLRTPDGMRVLLRARPIEPIVSDALPLEAALARLVEGTRDGILVTDARGLVLGANRALVRLAQAADEDGIRGRPLAEWLGRVESDVAQVVQAVRERGMVQGMRLQIRDAGQQAQVVDVMGMLLIEDQQECLGFVMRPVQAVQADTPVSGTLAMGQALEAVALDLGRRPLSDLLHSAERLARRHLVQRALDITPTDAAAAMLLNIDVAQLTRMAADLGAARATGVAGATGLG